MSKRVVFRVLPRKSHGWQITRDGKNLEAHDIKHWAVYWARDFARQLLNAGGLAQVVVHKKDGKLQTEWTYGKDPRRSVG